MSHRQSKMGWVLHRHSPTLLVLIVNQIRIPDSFMYWLFDVTEQHGGQFPGEGAG